MADDPARTLVSGDTHGDGAATNALASGALLSVFAASACAYAAAGIAIAYPGHGGHVAVAALAALLFAARALGDRPRTRHAALLCGAGAMASALGALVAGFPALAGVAPNQMSLSPEGSLCVLALLGGAMLAERGRPQPAAVLFAAAAVLSAATLLAWSHVPPRSMPADTFALDWWWQQRMQPLHAIAPLGAALAGLLSTLGRRTRQADTLVWLVGVTTLTAALASLVASSVGASLATTHLSYPSAAVPSALGLAGVSTWLMLRERPLRDGAAWLPLAAAMVLTLAALRLAWFVESDRHAREQKEAEVAAASAERAIQSALAVRRSSVESFAQRLLTVSVDERPRLFEVEAAQALRAGRALQSVGRVDHDRIIRQIATVYETSQRLVGRSALFDAARAEAYERAERSGRVVAIGPLLLSGTDIDAMLVIYPGPFGDGDTEFLVAGFSIADMVALALDGVAPGYAIEATIGGQRRMLRPLPAGTPWRLVAERRFTALDADWSLSIAQDRPAPAGGVPASRAIIIAGMLLGVLVALALRLAATARERAKVAEAAIAALREESAARASSEAALARSEQQAQRLLESMSDGVLMLDREFRIVFANSRAREMIGDLVADPAGLPVGQVFAHFGGSAFERGFREALEHKRSIALEGFAPTLGRWLSGRVHPMEHGVTAIFDDVTEMHRAESFERDQRELLRAIASGSPVDDCVAAAVRSFQSRFPGTAAAVLRLDAATRRVEAAVAPSLPAGLFEPLLGAPLPPDAGCCGEAAACAGTASMLAIAGDPRAAGMAQALHSAGFRACWSQAILDTRGKVIGTFAAYLRESRAATAEEAAAAQTVAALAGIAIERDLAALRVETERQRFRSLSERSPYLVYAFDVDRRLVDCNDNVVREGGFTRGQLRGMDAESLVLKPFRGTVRRCFEAALRGESTRFDCAVMTATGARREVEATLVPIEVDGRITGVFGVVRDITEERRTAAELDRALRDLTARNRELQDFAYVASHDLQEPLRKVQAFSDRVIQRWSRDLDPLAVDYLRRIDGAAHRMQVLIDDLLAYSRVTSLGQPFAAVDLGAVVTEVLSDLEVRVDESQAKVAIGPLPVVDGDATQLRQLMQNLLANAIKFRAPGRRPEIRVDSAPTGDGSAIISVEDNGIGFDPAYADRIFAPFQRLHGRHEYDGTGIGLAVVRRIVERHRGQIEAIGRPGEGARFEVTLPLHGG